MSVRVQTLVGAALLTLLDLSMVTNAIATRQVAPAALAAGATLGWVVIATLAWRSQRRSEVSEP